MANSDNLLHPDELLELAIEFVEEGASRGITLRLLGSLAVRAHTEGPGGLLDLLERVPTHDIDYMGYSGDQAAADRYFVEELGYQPDPAVAHSLEYGINRLIYYQQDGPVMVEVFLDQLRMAHTLDFRGRLELDSPTVSLVDLLLTKLQIVQITEKDIKDMIALLAGHKLGGGGRDEVDVDYLIRLTSKDWGLYHTAYANLQTLRQWTTSYEVLDLAIREDVTDKVDSILERLEEAQKSPGWILRSLIGTRVKWYEDVGDVHR